MARYYHRDWRGRFASGGGFTGGNSVMVRGPRQTRVTQLVNGRAVKPGKLGARVFAAGRVGRAGSPIKGNKNVRFVSRGHGALRAASINPIGAGTKLGIGRALSARAVRGDRAPRNGYVVSYSHGSRRG
jgi:hypothetical protein